MAIPTLRKRLCESMSKRSRPTGSGKTLAFGVPLVDLIPSQERSNQLRGRFAQSGLARRLLDDRHGEKR
jgi:hypothetical protein